MKTKPHCLVTGLFLLLSFVQTQIAGATVTFSVTPSAVSNAYNGTITLQIGGLTNGETASIKRYLDVNTNGVIDTNDLMVQYFQLTVGQTGAMVIGGVTNINVPFNSNTNTNAITTTFNFQNETVFSQTLVGQYLFEVSSPSGQITNAFTVTNSYAQQFTGTVVSGTNAIPNAIVLLLPPAGGNGFFPGAVANNSGLYSIEAPAGSYTLAAFKNNFVANLTAAANLALTNGQTLTTNLNLIPATETISGRSIDAVTSNGLPAVLVLMSAGDLEGGCFTDTNGNFSAGVTANQWNVNPTDSAVALLGYVGTNNPVLVMNAAFGSVSNVIIPAYKATALFYGYLMDNLGNPLPGVAIEAEDTGTIYDSFGTTAANGYYVVAAVGGLGPVDGYTVGIASAELYPNYSFSMSSYTYGNGGTNLATNTAVLQNFTATNLQSQGAEYTFGPQVQSTNTASITYNSGSNTFQYTDAANSSDDSARLPLTGTAATLITISNNWTATLTASISSNMMSATISESPHVWMQIGLYYMNGSSTYLLTFGLEQENNTGGANDENFPSGFYGTAADFRARTNGNDDVTTALGTSQLIQGGSVLLLSGGTNASPATESIGAATGALTLNYSVSKDTVTGYYNGTPIGSYSLASWGSNPSLTLFVSGSSGQGIGVSAGAATARNFFAGLLPTLAIIPSGTNVVLTWPTNATGFTLQSITNLTSTNWSNVSPLPAVVNGQNTVTNSISGKQTFYRLSQ